MSRTSRSEQVRHQGAATLVAVLTFLQELHAILRGVGRCLDAVLHLDQLLLELLLELLDLLLLGLLLADPEET